MFTIVLDYSDARVKLVEHPSMQVDEVENLLSEEYGLSESNIEWMTVEKLQIETLD